MSSLYVICKVANGEYAIPASEVFQMETYSDITPVPQTANYVSGLIQIRQQVMPVVDLRVRFGWPAITPTENSRFIVLKTGKRLVSLLVDSAKEVLTFKDEDFHVPPQITGDGGLQFIKSVTQIKDRIIMSIDTQKVVGEEIQNG